MMFGGCILTGPAYRGFEPPGYGAGLGVAGGLVAAVFAGPVAVAEGLVFGVSYALLFRGRSFAPAPAAGWGVSSGFLWWVLEHLDRTALIAHVLAGAVLGVAYQRLEERTSPWWLTRDQVAVERATALREQILSSAPARWTLVLLLAVVIPTLAQSS